MLAVLFCMVALAVSLKPTILPSKLLRPSSKLFVSSVNKDRPTTFPAPRSTRTYDIPSKESDKYIFPTSKRTPYHNVFIRNPDDADGVWNHIPTSSPPITFVAMKPILPTLEQPTSRSPTSALLPNNNLSRNSLLPSTKALTVEPSLAPSSSPSFPPSKSPSASPTVAPVTPNPSRSPTVAPVTSHPSRSPSVHSSKNPTPKPSSDPSFLPSFLPSKVPSSSDYLTGSTLFFLSTVPSAMDNETHNFFYDATSKFVVDILINSSIIKTEHDLVEFHLQSNVIDNSNFTGRLPLSSGIYVPTVQYRTLKVVMGLEIRLHQWLISPLIINWLLSTAVLSPTYMDSLQSNDKSGFFSRALIFSAYASAEMQTSAIEQQEEEALKPRQNTRNQSLTAIIAVSVLSTLLVIVLMSIIVWFFKRNRRGMLNISDTKHGILNSSTKGDGSKLEKHMTSCNENLRIDVDGEHELNMLPSIDQSWKRTEKNPFVQQHILPYPPNSALTYGNANLGSGSHPVNTSMTASSKLNTTTARLHSTIPPQILLDGVEEAYENQDGNVVYSVPEYALVGQPQHPRNVYSDSNSPCHSSLSNSPATAFGTIGGATIEPKYNVAQAALQKSLVVEASNQDSLIAVEDGFDLESYYSKSSKATKRSSRSQKNRATRSEKRIVSGEIYQVDAPLSGRLGLTIDSTESQGPPTIREIKNYSPLFGVVQLGDSIMMIDGYVTEDMSSGQITQLLAHLRHSRSDGNLCIRITLLRTAESLTDCDRGNIPNVARYQVDQEYGLGIVEAGSNFNMMVDPSTNVPMPSQAKILLGRTTEPISEGEEEESVEESIHLLGSLEKGEESLITYHEYKDYNKLMMSMDIHSEPDRQNVIVVDEREPECFDTRYEEGDENTYHLLGGLNRGSFDNDGQESL